MAQSLALVLVHIIFSTKNRSPFLQSTEVRSQAHAYLTATLRALDCAPLEVGRVADPTIPTYFTDTRRMRLQTMSETKL
jgi:putative transposase